MYRNMFFAVWFSLAAITLVGCASNSAYRNDTSGVCSLGDEHCSSSLELSGESLHDSEVALAFVEINDQGVLRERPQLNRIVDLIRLRGEEKPQTVLMFVHGWHNNAKANNGNVEQMRQTLAAYASANPGIAVTGVYVGWRGTAWGFSNLFSFWSRKEVSIEVGTGALIDVVSSVERASKQVDALMVSVGHSFGGSALFNATKSLLLSRLDSPPATDAQVPFPAHAAVGDLVLVLNPAFEALQYWPLHAAVRSRISERVEAGQAIASTWPPRLLIYQSQDDSATRIAFPAARFFPLIFETHASDSESRDSDVVLGEFGLDMYGIGHYCEMNTHDVVDPKQVDGQGNYRTQGCKKIRVNDGLDAGDVVFTNGSFKRCGQDVDPNLFKAGAWTSPSTGLSIAPRSNHMAGNPFWVVYDSVQNIDHSDLNDAGLQCLLADLLKTYTLEYTLSRK